MNIDEFRKNYPQYSHISDFELADRLYERYYTEKISRDDFDRKFLGFNTRPLEEPTADELLKMAQSDPTANFSTELSEEEEKNFQREYEFESQRLGLNPDPDAPQQHYDYRGYYKKYGTLQTDESNHFTSEFKRYGHPTYHLKFRETHDRSMPQSQPPPKLSTGVSEEVHAVLTGDQPADWALTDAQKRHLKASTETEEEYNDLARKWFVGTAYSQLFNISLKEALVYADIVSEGMFGMKPKSPQENVEWIAEHYQNGKISYHGRAGYGIYGRPDGKEDEIAAPSAKDIAEMGANKKRINSFGQYWPGWAADQQRIRDTFTGKTARKEKAIHDKRSAIPRWTTPDELRKQLPSWETAVENNWTRTKSEEEFKEEVERLFAIADNDKKTKFTDNGYRAIASQYQVGYQSMFSFRELWAVGEASKLDMLAWAADAEDALWHRKIVTAMEKLSDGEPYPGRAKDEEMALKYLALQHELAQRGTTRLATLAKEAMRLPAFMIEFYFTKGFGNLGGSMTRKALAKIGGEAVVGKAKTWLLATIVAAGYQTTANPTRWAANYYQRRVQAAKNVSEDEANRVIIEFQEKPVTSFFKALGAEWAEMFSERSGDAIGAAFGWLGAKTPIVNKFIPALQRGWVKFGGGTPAAFVAKVSSETGWHGMLKEYGEERLRDAIAGVLGIDPYYLPTWEQFVNEMILFAIPGATFRGAFLVSRATATKIPQAETDTEVNEAIREIQAAAEEKVDEETGEVTEPARELTDKEQLQIQLLERRREDIKARDTMIKERARQRELLKKKQAELEQAAKEALGPQTFQEEIEQTPAYGVAEDGVTVINFDTDQVVQTFTSEAEAAQAAEELNLGAATTEAGQFRPTESIAQAAVQLEGQTFEGLTHLDALKTAHQVLAPEQSFDDFVGAVDQQFHGETDGFVTDTGRYVSAEEAAVIAKRSGQVTEVSAQGPTAEALASEDLTTQAQPTQAEGQVRRAKTTPEVGMEVTGTYLDVPIKGKIASFRFHTINPDLVTFTIDLDSPTDVLGAERTSVNVSVAPSTTDGNLISNLEGDNTILLTGQQSPALPSEQEVQAEIQRELAAHRAASETTSAAVTQTAQAFAEATPPQTLEQLKDQIQKASPGQIGKAKADALGAMIAGHAQMQARITGQEVTPNQIVRQLFRGVVEGGQPAGGALFAFREGDFKAAQKSGALSPRSVKVFELMERAGAIHDQMTALLRAQPAGFRNPNARNINLILAKTPELVEQITQFEKDAAAEHVGGTMLRDGKIVPYELENQTKKFDPSKLVIAKLDSFGNVTSEKSRKGQYFIVDRVWNKTDKKTQKLLRQYATGRVAGPFESKSAARSGLKRRRDAGVPVSTDIPVHGALGRSLSQTWFESMFPGVGETFRTEVTGAIEAAYANGTLKQEGFGIDLAIANMASGYGGINSRVFKNAHKTAFALNLNTMCPMLQVGPHGCYMGCYMVVGWRAANAQTVYRSGSYTGEILQWTQQEVDIANQAGGLRLNGLGDWLPEFDSQIRDIVRHAKMRGLQLKVISKQRSTWSMINSMYEDGLIDKNKPHLLLQPTLDPYWVDADDDASEVQGGFNAVMARTNDPSIVELAKKYYLEADRESMTAAGRIWRKYGLTEEQYNNWRKQHPNIPNAGITKRYVIGSPQDIFEVLRRNKGTKIILTWMHASVPGGLYNDIAGRVLAAGEVKNYDSQMIIRKSSKTGKWEVLASKGLKAAQEETVRQGLSRTVARKRIQRDTAKYVERYSEVADYIYANARNEAEADELFRALKDATCCQANENADACLGCSNPGCGIMRSVGVERGLYNKTDNEGIAQASVEFDEDGRALIRALQNSTSVADMVHELGHVFRRNLGNLAEQGYNEAREMLDTLEDFAGVQDGIWDVQAEEKIANAFEKFSSTGQAPTAKLKKAFENLKQWFRDIYQGIVQANVQLSDEVNNVFARILGAEPQIETEVQTQPRTQRTGTRFGLAADKRTVVDFETQQEMGTFKTQAAAQRQANRLNSGEVVPKTQKRARLLPSEKEKPFTIRQLLNFTMKAHSKSAQRGFMDGAKATVENHTNLAKYAAEKLKGLDITKAQRRRLLNAVTRGKSDTQQVAAMATIESIAERAAHRNEVAKLRKTASFVNRQSKIKKLNKGIRPEYLKKIKDLMDSFVFTTPSVRTKERLQSLENHINNLRNQDTESFGEEVAEALLPSRLLKMLDKVDVTPVAQMTAEEVQDINNAIQALLHLNATKNRLISARGLRETAETLNTILDQQEDVVDKSVITKRNRLDEDFQNNSLIRKAWSFIATTANHDVETLIHTISGGQEGALYENISEELSDGRQKSDKYYAEAVRDLLDTLTDNNITLADLQKISSGFQRFFKKGRFGEAKEFARKIIGKGPTTPRYKVTLAGKVWELEMDELMDIYMHTQAKFNLEALVDQGIASIHAEHGTLSVEELDAVAKLVEADKTAMVLIRAAQDHYANRAKDGINETSIRLLGHAIAVEENYWRVTRFHRGGNLAQRQDSYSIAKTLESDSRLQARTGSSRPIVISTFFSKLLADISATAEYVGMAPAYRNAKMILNFRGFKDKVDSQGYKQERQAVAEILRRAEDPSFEADRLDRVVMGLMRGLTRTALSGPNVMLGQYVSVNGVFDEVHGRYRRPGLVRVPTRKEMARLAKNWPLLMARMMGGVSSIALQDIRSSDLALRTLTGKTDIANIVTSQIHNVDIRAITAVGRIVEAEMADPTRKGKSKQFWDRQEVEPSNLEKGSPEYWAAFNKRANFVTRRTQPMFRGESRSLHTSPRKPSTRVWFLFRSYIDQPMRMAYRAYTERANDRATRRSVARRWANIYITLMSYAVVGWMTDKYLFGQDRDWKDLVFEMLSAPIKMFALIGFPVKKVLQTFVEVKRGEQLPWHKPKLDNIATGFINRTLSSTVTLAEGLALIGSGETFQSGRNKDKSKSQVKIWQGLYEQTINILGLYGIPAHLIDRAIRNRLKEDPENFVWPGSKS